MVIIVTGPDEVDSAEDTGRAKAAQAVQHGARLRKKLQRRLTRQALAEAKAIKEQIHVLVYVAELVSCFYYEYNHRHYSIIRYNSVSIHIVSIEFAREAASVCNANALDNFSTGQIHRAVSWVAYSCARFCLGKIPSL